MNLKKLSLVKGLALSVSLAALFLNSCLFANADTIDISTSAQYTNANTFQSNNTYEITNDIEVGNTFSGSLSNKENVIFRSKDDGTGSTYSIIGSTALDAYSTRAMEIFGSNNVTFENLNFKHFAHFEPSAIHIRRSSGANGDILFRHVKISDIKSLYEEVNKPDGRAVWGSAFCLDSGSHMSLDDVTIADIEVKSRYGGNSQTGGGIHVQGNQNDGYGTSSINTINESEFKNIKILTQVSLTESGSPGGAYGGAIYNAGEIGEIIKTRFSENAVQVTAENTSAQGGAIYTGSRNSSAHNTPLIGTIQDSVFDKNFVEVVNADAKGGALSLGANAEIDLISNTQFAENKAVHTSADGSSYGGAIYNEGAISNISGSTFESNSAGTSGGAIYNEGAISNISGSTFESNSAGTSGGAIFADSQISSISNSTFESNSAGTSGGAIYADSQISSISNSLFTGNTAGTLGGAIYAERGANITLEDGTVMYNNKDSLGANDIYLDENVNMSIGSGLVTDADKKPVVLASGIASKNASSALSISSPLVLSGNNARFAGETYLGSTTLTYSPQSAKDTFLGGTKYFGTNSELIVNANYDSEISSIIGTGQIVKNGARSLILSGDNSGFTGNLQVNQGSFGLASGAVVGPLESAQFLDGTYLNLANNSTKGRMHFDSLNLNGNVGLGLDVDFKNHVADVVSADSVTGNGRFVLDVHSMGELGNLTKDMTVQVADGALRSGEYVSVDGDAPYVAGPIQKYSLTYDDGFLSFAKMGGKNPGIKDVNPAVMSSVVASQTGAYFAQLEALESSFYRMDRHFRFSRNQRLAVEQRNAYASLGQDGVYRPDVEDSSAMWVKPYTSFEKVSLRGGVDVSNVMYGSLYGGDSEFVDLGHGFRGTLSPFVGYSGSHQSFDGISMYQNGGVLGVNGTLYKGDFFTGLTFSTGANVGQASTVYGNDNFTMLTAGAGSKSGYNFEFKDGEFIVQPNVFVGYTFVNALDYTNAANLRIKSDPLNAVQVVPGLNLIGNLKNGWQPYLGVNVVMNFMGESRVRAYDTALPQLSVKPYVQYGAGVQKTWKDNFSAYFQTMLRSGGRQGVAFGAGFTWAIGRDLNRVKKDKKGKKEREVKLNLAN